MNAPKAPKQYGPNNPPRLRNPGETLEQYRAALGWDQPTPEASKPSKRDRSILELALQHDLLLDIGAHSVEVSWFDTDLSETFQFREHVHNREERRGALRRCVEKAVAKALECRT